MPRSAATTGYNVAFFRITLIAAHCTDGLLFLASSRAFAAQTRERRKIWKSSRTRSRIQAGPYAYQLETKELRQAHSPKTSLSIRVFGKREYNEIESGVR